MSDRVLSAPCRSYSEEPGAPPPYSELFPEEPELSRDNSVLAPEDVQLPPPLTRTTSGPIPATPEDVRIESRPYDSTQEIRAMILAALPYPPLPVIVERLDEDNRVCEGVIQTSHDILANLLIHACAKRDKSQNAERKDKQTQVLRSLIDHMANRGQLQSIPELYDTYCHHTRLHVGTYLPPDSKQPPLRFAPLASVCRGDPIHRRMCDYMAGQAVILEEANGHCAQDWLCREYADMLTINRARLLADAPNRLTQPPTPAAAPAPAPAASQFPQAPLPPTPQQDSTSTPGSDPPTPCPCPT